MFHDGSRCRSELDAYFLESHFMDLIHQDLKNATLLSIVGVVPVEKRLSLALWKRIVR